ncbi:RNA polymerase sigma factor [Streptomyces sp. NPDC055013]
MPAPARNAAWLTLCCWKRSAVTDCGGRNERFVTQLTQYALAIFKGWTASGEVFDKAARAARPIPTHKIDKSWGRADRLDVAAEAIAGGLKIFRTYALERKRWHPRGGASLTTYFVGACVLAFPAAYLNWFHQREHWRRVVIAVGHDEDPQTLLDQIPAQQDSDPALQAALWDEIERLPIHDPRTRRCLYLCALGFTQAEAGERVGLSPRAVEGRLRRLRHKLQNGPMEGGTS